MYLDAANTRKPFTLCALPFLYICMCVYTCSVMYARAGQRSTPGGVFLNYCPPSRYIPGLSLNLELTGSLRLAVQRASGSSCLHLLNTNYKKSAAIPIFLNSHLQTCVGKCQLSHFLSHQLCCVLDMESELKRTLKAFLHLSVSFS